MKHIVSWTLSDVPQEARELARASALREGISVGDWLARRILAEGQQGNAPPATNGNSFHSDSDHLDTKRPYDRDGDAIRFACVEAETHSAILPIHETMRGLRNRFETTHRSDEQEISRVRSPEPDVTTREQDLAFQRLSERMDRVERHADTKGLRDAVRGLHQGLSRVAEQVAGITNECAGQFTTLARSIEVLAKDVAGPRGESKQTIQVLEARVAELQERLEHDKHQIEGALHLEDRLKRAEERIASSSTSEECLARLELRIKAAEERIQEAFAGPIAAIQGNFDCMNARLRRAEEREEMDAQAQDGLFALTVRLDAAEQKNCAIQAELNDIDKAVKSIEAIENNQSLGVPLGPVPAFSDPSPVPTGSHAADANETGYAADESFHRHINPSSPSTSDFVAQARRAAQSTANTVADPDRPNRQQVRTSRRKVSKTVSALIAVAALIVLVLAIGVSTKRNSARTAELATPNLLNHTASLQSANTIKARTGFPSSPSAAHPIQPPLVLANAAPNTITASPAPPPTQIPEGTGKPSATHGAGSEASTTDTDDGRLLEAQAKAGNAVAQYRLGTRYENGRGVVANAPEAVHWYSEAAKRGNRKAMHNLGTAYASGKGTQKDLSAAARWFKAAADLGVTDSQFNLAMLYEHGLGVPFSIMEAYKWYAIAAGDGGDPESKTRVAALSSQIPLAEREAANRTAKIFKPQPMNLAANEDSR